MASASECDPVAALRRARDARRRVGLQRSPAQLWSTQALRDDAPVIVAEDHGGFALGGNKVRHLDRILAEALDQHADAVVTAVGSHSNLARVLSAAARQLGLDVHLVLRGQPDDIPRGNQACYTVCQATLRFVPVTDPFSPEQTAAAEQEAHSLRERGRRPFVVDVRENHAPLSGLAETELVDELEPALPWRPDTVVVAAGAGSTAAGLWVALAARRWSTRLLAVSVNVAGDVLRDRITAIATDIAAVVGMPAELLDAVELEVTDAFIGPGYAVPTAAGWDAIERTGRAAGVFLDPTYTAKAMAALLHDADPGRSLFVHTGGVPALFEHPFRTIGAS